jgi:hypothetical protein
MKQCGNNQQRRGKGGTIITTKLFPKHLLTAAWVVIFAGCLFAQQETPVVDSSPGKTSIFGYTAIEFGEVEHGRYIKDLNGINHNWIGSGYLNLSVKSSITDYFSTLGSVELHVGYETSPLSEIFDPTEAPPSKNIYITVPNAEGILSFGKKGTASFTLGAGLFEYKYNPEAQNLGEYLFRTGTYPAYIITSFDLPLARLAGAVASCQIGDFLRQDLLLSTMNDIKPFMDISLTYLVDAKIGPALDIGGAVQFANLISPMSDQTSVTNYEGNGYLSAPGDTSYYTFKGTKLMGRFMFDPKKFFDAPFFGEADGKLYVEAAVLGLESYPSSSAIDSFNVSNVKGYDNLWQKIPVMMGFNIPTFKLLDRAALEAEWYGCRYPVGYGEVINNGYSVPSQPSNDGYTWDDYRKDDWKWSINIEKTFFKRASFIFQAARDHLKLETTIKKDADYDDVLVRSKHWYWMGKLKFNF